MALKRPTQSPREHKTCRRWVIWSALTAVFVLIGLLGMVLLRYIPAANGPKQGACDLQLLAGRKLRLIGQN